MKCLVFSYVLIGHKPTCLSLLVYLFINAIISNVSIFPQLHVSLLKQPMTHVVFSHTTSKTKIINISSCIHGCVSIPVYL